MTANIGRQSFLYKMIPGKTLISFPAPDDISNYSDQKKVSQLTLSRSSMVAGNFSTKNLQEFEECLRCSVWAVTTSTLPPGLPSQTCEVESGQSDRELQQNKVYFLQQQEIICKCLISLSMILTTVVTKVNI